MNPIEEYLQVAQDKYAMPRYQQKPQYLSFYFQVLEDGPADDGEINTYTNKKETDIPAAPTQRSGSNLIKASKLINQQKTPMFKVSDVPQSGRKTVCKKIDITQSRVKVGLLGNISEKGPVKTVKLVTCDETTESKSKPQRFSSKIDLSNIRNPVPSPTKSSNDLFCGLCGKLFIKLGDLKKHMSTHTGKKPFKCDFCGKTFSQNSNLKTHQLRHGLKKHVDCSVCGSTFVTKSELLQHKQIHKTKSLYKCDICGQNMKNAQSFQRHKKSHEAMYQNQCSVCSQMFESESKLATHIKSFPSLDHKHCSLCFTDFANQEEFDKHACVNLQSKSRDFTCDQCSKSFGSKSYLKQHILTKHNGIKPYHCSICDKSFSSMFYFSHMKIHSQSTKFKCHICDKFLASHGELQRHVRAHTGECVCTCDICGKNFRSKSNLNSHMKSHLNTRPFHCDVCKKSFRDKSDLTIHKRIHTGEKPFSCQFCDAAFRSVSALNVHNKSHFTKKSTERVPCPMCDKTFSTKYNRNTHVSKLHGTIEQEPSIVPTTVPTDLLDSEYSTEIAIYTSYT